MRNPACLYLNYASSFICDGSSLKSYGFGPDRIEWADDEIKAIRAVLQRLASIRIMNANDVEDIVQETLLTMISRHPGTELQKGLLVWSMGILRRKLGNYYRKIRRYAPLNEQDASFRQFAPSLSPDARLFQEELKAIIDEVLAQIPPFQRQAMELFIAGLNAREIAEELYPVRYQNVINRLHRGRKKLAEALSRYGYGPESTPALRRMKTASGRLPAELKKTSTSAK